MARTGWKPAGNARSTTDEWLERSWQTWIGQFAPLSIHFLSKSISAAVNCALGGI